MTLPTLLPRSVALIAALLVTGSFAGQAQAATLQDGASNAASQSTGAGAGKVTFNPF
jgi:hypothetical protein